MVPASSSSATLLSDLPIAPPETIAYQGKEAARPKRGPFIIPTVLALLSLAGIALAFWLRTVPAGITDPRLWFNVFFVLFSRNEVAGLAIVALFSIVTAGAIFHRRGTLVVERAVQWLPAGEKRLLATVAVAVFAICVVGTYTVFHNYQLTADEYLADFQAKIFLRGKIQAEVPAAWVDAVPVIKPTFVDYFPGTHRWNATYLPVYAAMRAVFQYFNLQSTLNPFLAAVTVLTAYGIARNIWPNSKLNAWITAGLLAASSQFLLMSMTSYSMPAHLALNTIWLWLYSRPDRRRFFLAPFIGVLALGLHQPVFHAVFVAPFLFRLVLQRKWQTSLFFAAVYLGGCALWLWWSLHFRSHFGANSVASTFRLVNPRMAFIQPMNLLLIISWSCLATPFLAILGAGRFLRLPVILQDATASCLVTFGFYFFFYLDQAHGWGYRYFHGVLVSFVLVAVAGFNRLSDLIGQGRALTFVIAGIVTSLLVQFPLRCYQAEKFVRPYAHAGAVLHAVPANMVAFDPREAWYSLDLVRNDPFLEQRPVMVSLFRLTPAAVAALEKNGTARFVTRDGLASFGLSTTCRDHYAHDPFKLGLGE